MRIRIKRSARAQCTTEMAAGLIVLVIAGLAMLDLGTLVLACTANDTLSRNAARAAAGAINTATGVGDETSARFAAYGSVNQFPESTMIQAPHPGDTTSYLQEFSYDGGTPSPNNGPANVAQNATSNPGQVLVITGVNVVVPAPFPFFSGCTFYSQSIQPIVSKS